MHKVTFCVTRNPRRGSSRARYLPAGSDRARYLADMHNRGGVRNAAAAGFHGAKAKSRVGTFLPSISFVLKLHAVGYCVIGGTRESKDKKDLVVGYNQATQASSLKIHVGFNFIVHTQAKLNLQFSLICINFHTLDREHTSCEEVVLQDLYVSARIVLPKTFFAG